MLLEMATRSPYVVSNFAFVLEEAERHFDHCFLNSRILSQCVKMSFPFTPCKVQHQHPFLSRNKVHTKTH